MILFRVNKNSLKMNVKGKNKNMKKQYTKKQIQEAIAYWEKQLAKGNYRKVNESISDRPIF